MSKPLPIRILSFFKWRFIYGKRYINQWLYVRRHGGKRGIFDWHYKNNTWKSEESVSGLGSTLEYTEPIRRELPILLMDYQIKSMLDLPCGDCNWMKEIDFGGIVYTGGDIVSALIEENSRRYQSGRVSFKHLDLLKDDLPAVDLWLCRDVLFHLSYADIRRAFANFLHSDIPYILTTTHSEHQDNRDIPTGSFRLLNLEIPPFNLPAPAIKLPDYIQGFPVRHLALWRKEDVRRAFE